MAKNKQSLRTNSPAVWSVPRLANTEIAAKNKLRFPLVASENFSSEQVMRVVTPAMTYFKWA